MSSNNFKRLLQLNLPRGQSAFLWGPRNTGKSAFLKASYPDSIHYDLLKSDVYLQLLKTPHTFREEVLASRGISFLKICGQGKSSEPLARGSGYR